MASLDEKRMALHNASIFDDNTVGPFRRMYDQFEAIKANKDVFCFVFNNEHASPPAQKGVAHMKGMIFFHGNQEIFVSYTIPRFPDLKRNDGYVINATRNAQHIFCCNIGKDALATISEHLWTAHPDIFFKNVPKEYLKIGKIQQIFDGFFREDFQKCMKYELTTRGNFPFTIYTRTHTDDEAKKYHASLWDELPKIYNQSFNVQTWYGKGDTKCTCCVKDGKSQVSNIQSTHVNGASWKRTQDHSKIGYGVKTNILSVCDLNHTVSF
uniref:Uncharacterized protein n=1 Tax=Panagrolaimus sp. ES5 TaxID=591445 RepID=A0AC34FW83_9BILA